MFTGFIQGNAPIDFYIEFPRDVNAWDFAQKKDVQKEVCMQCASFSHPLVTSIHLPCFQRADCDNPLGKMGN